MSKPFFTIGIPVFKTEAFLEQCLESVKAQDFTDFECLVINDGSPGVNQSDFKTFQDPDFQSKIDFSTIEGPNQIEFIFKAVVGNDKRFKLINKPNGGVSSARNKIVENSSGKYLVQVDPDDWLTPNHLSNFYQALVNYKGKKFPIAKFVIDKFYNTKKALNIYLPKKITLANTIHSCTFMNVSFAIDLDLVQKYNLKFDERLGRGALPQTRISSGGEDFLFGYEYLNAAEKEFGYDGFEIIDLKNDTYMYRELAVNQKLNEDNLGPIRYAKYFQQFGLKNPRLKIKLITLVLPFWTWLRLFKNPFAVLLRKSISLCLRLLSD